jgi:restriction endonuclease Mrr
MLLICVAAIAVIAVVSFIVEHPLALLPSAVVVVVAGFFARRMVRLLKERQARLEEERERAKREAKERLQEQLQEQERRKEEERQELAAQRREQEKKWEAERQERKRQKEAQRQERKRQRREWAKQAEEEQRRRIEAMLHPDRVRNGIYYMSGPEFERFMADLFRQKGYVVEETPLSGDQGVDLILPDLDGKRVVIQLKRWTGPVGNATVQATFAGMAYYEAAEGWIITTGTFTKSAQELATRISVRLIDGKELADWLEGLREDE